MSRLEQVYLRLPVAVQNWVVSLEGLRIQRRRYGAGFRAAERQVLAQDLLRGGELQDLRVRRLHQLLQAASHSPYWREQFSQCGVHAASADPFNELAKLPVLTKDVVKANVDGIINPTLDRKGLLWRHTSGTTGSGLVFPETPDTEHCTWAFWWRYRRWHGLTPETRCGYFGGRSLVPVESRKPPYWRINRPARQLMLSGYHLSCETAPAYLEALRNYDVEWLHGYPSMLVLLAQYAVDGRLKVDLPRLKCITTGAESLSDAQRAAIRGVFGVPVVQHYGQAEAAANISECEHGQLHVDEDFAAVEMVENPHDPSSARLLGSNWLNPAFPLLRYDTGDLVVPGHGSCPCGRPGRLVAAIDGRKEDYLVLPGGARIGRLDHILKDMVHIREAQFVQHDPASVTVRVARGAGYSEQDEAQLRHEIRQRIGSAIEVRVDYVESLPRGPNGKLRLVVSALPRS